MNTDVAELLLKWKELIIQYYAESFSFVNTYDEVLDEITVVKNSILAHKSEVGYFFLYGAEDLYTGCASGAPSTAGHDLAEALLEDIKDGKVVSQDYDGLLLEYLKGAEWWYSTSNGEEL